MSDIKGYYIWTYGKNGPYNLYENLTDYKNRTSVTYNLNYNTSIVNWLPKDSTNVITISFSGWLDAGLSDDRNDKNTAIGQGSVIYPTMIGKKYCSLGGGGSQWTKSVISNLTNSINNNVFKNYQGICYDVEAGDSGLAEDFNKVFQLTKEKNLDVFVTISHTAPYAFGDADVIMKSFFQCPYVDIMSPQLYTDDIGVATEYDASNKFSWTDFKTYYDKRGNVNLKIYPSIWSNQNVNGSYDLFNTGGTNHGKTPMFLYGMSAADNALFSSKNWNKDMGVKDFFCNILNIPSDGSIQFICGSIKSTLAPVPPTPPPTPVPTPPPTPVPTPPPTPVPTPPPTPVPTPSPTPVPTPVPGSILPWKNITLYKINDLCTYNNITYICLTTHTSLISWVPPQTPTLWKIYTPPISDIDWKNNCNYKVGDICLYKDIKYTCTITHTSLINWTPDVSYSLWKKYNF